MFEAYSVGIRLSLINGVSSGLRLLAAEFRTAGVHAAELDRRIAGIKKTLLIGGGLTIAGLGILGAFKPALDEARKFQTETAKFATFGLGDAMTMQAVKFAKATKVVGTSYVDMMRFMNESQGVFRESGLAGPEALRGAKIAAPILAKIAFANAALHPDDAGGRDAQALAMLRFIEMRGGVKDPATFARIAELGFKAINSSNRNISWEQLRQFMSRGGVAAQGISDQVLFGKLEPVIGELKGSTAGQAWMTAYNRMEGLVRLPNQVAHELTKNGLWDPSKIVWNSQGGIKQFKGNPLTDPTLFATDPVAYYQKYVLPMYAARGLDQNGRNRENALIFGRTGGNFFSLIDRQMNAITMSVGAQAKALGIDASDARAMQTLMGKQIQAHKDYRNLLEHLGEVALPLVVKGLQAVIPLLEKLNAWAERNPKAFGRVVDGILLLGAALAASGIVTILTGFAGAARLLFGVFGGPVARWVAIRGLGLLAGGFDLLGAGLALLTAPVTLTIAAVAGFGIALYQIVKHWDSSKSVLENVKFEFALFFNWLLNQVRGLAGMSPLAAPRDPSKPYGATGTWGAPPAQKPFVPGGGSFRAPGHSPYVAGGGKAAPMVQVNTTTNLDGKALAQTVSTHQARAIGAQRAGPARHDPNASLAAAGAGARR